MGRHACKNTTSSYLQLEIVELAGRNRLASELQKANIEVARPERDHGVDLLAYLDLEEKFCARPIQMKAATGEIFNVQRRYEIFPELMLIYVWNVNLDKSRYFALTYKEAEDVAREMKWTETASWRGETSGPPGYGVWKVNDELLRLLADHEITEPDQWRKKLFPEVALSVLPAEPLNPLPYAASRDGIMGKIANSFPPPK